jgi:hemerythrin-like domain-containing protein
MTILLANLLNDLSEDHHNMSAMLDLLEQQVDHIRDGERPDYELIHDIMRYMTVYSDAVHHPKEDLLYTGIRSEQPDVAPSLERIETEHREIAALGETLRNDIEAVASGTAVTRERVIADTTEYVRTLRKHMAWEKTFFSAPGISSIAKNRCSSTSRNSTNRTRCSGPSASTRSQTCYKISEIFRGPRKPPADFPFVGALLGARRVSGEILARLRLAPVALQGALQQRSSRVCTGRVAWGRRRP